MSSLAAARADNFYFPKDYDPSKGSLNQFQKSHPLGDRAKKINQGILVVRYETPFHIRCQKCQNMIGKGVRFNAEKKCIGKYMTTKIYEFKMNCHNCGNKIISQTDPENTQFKYVEGAKQWMDTQNATDAEFLPDPKDKQRMKEDAFYNLEQVMDDQNKAQKMAPLLHNLEKQNDEKYKLDFEVNLKMRRTFKDEKKIIEEREKEEKKPKNFALRLVTPNINDALEAQQKRFRTSNQARLNKYKKREEIRTQDIFKKQKDDKEQEIRLKLSKLPKATQKHIKYEIKQQNIIKNQLGTLNKF